MSDAFPSHSGLVLYRFEDITECSWSRLVRNVTSASRPLPLALPLPLPRLGLLVNFFFRQNVTEDARDPRPHRQASRPVLNRGRLMRRAGHQSYI